MQLTTTQTEEEWNDPPHLLVLSLCCSTRTLWDNISYYIILTLSLTFELQSPLSHCFSFMSFFIHILCKWIHDVTSCILELLHRWADGAGGAIVQSCSPGDFISLRLHQRSEPELKSSSLVDPHTQACGGSVCGWRAGRVAGQFDVLKVVYTYEESEVRTRTASSSSADGPRSKTAPTFRY